MVKKFFFFAVVAMMAVSCLKSTYNSSYQVGVNFEISKDYYDKDSIYHEQILGMGGVYFLNSHDEESGEFGGCIMSMAHNIHTENCSPYSVCDTAAHLGTDGFLLFYENSVTMPEHAVVFDQYNYGTCNPVGCYIQNTTEVVGAVRDRFTDGDWLLLTATGYRGTSETGSATIYLADFREAKDSVVTNWTAFDLSKLGAIQYIDFQVTSSRDDIPGNFCIDDFFANVVITSEQ